MVTTRAFMSASNAAPKRAMKWRASTLSPWKLFRSAPAEKNFEPAPVSTAAYTSRSAFSRPTSSSSSRRLSGVQVFAGGLSMVTKAVWLRVSCLITTLQFHVLEDHAGEILRAVAVHGMLLVDLLSDRAQHD